MTTLTNGRMTLSDPRQHRRPAATQVLCLAAWITAGEVGVAKQASGIAAVTIGRPRR